jgi:Ser/Thr protein kinase RdoA (MazF antagonist)
MLELAEDYFVTHKHVLEGGAPALLHGDLTMINILVNGGNISALIDFEYAMMAPVDYELWAMEAFCLYPNDYAEEDREIFSTADFAGFFPLLRKYYPELFETPNLRRRMNLYQIDAGLSSYVAWRKDNLQRYPPEKMAAKEFYLARISNFVFEHGVRMFYE